MKYIWAAIAVYLASYIFHPDAEWEFLVGCNQLVIAMLSIVLLKLSDSLSTMERSVVALLAIACSLDFIHYSAWIIYDIDISGALAIIFFFWLGFLVIRPYDIEGDEFEYGKVFILIKKPSKWIDNIRALIGIPASSVCIRINDSVWSFRHKTGIFEKFDASLVDEHILINTGVSTSRSITSKLNSLIGVERGIGCKCIWSIRDVLGMLGDRFKVRTIFDCIPGLYLRKIFKKEGKKWICSLHSI